MVHCRVIRGVYLYRIVAAATQPVDVFVRQMRYQRLQVRILVEKLFAVEAAVGGGVFLEFAVDGFVQAFENHVFGIAGEQRIPLRTPQQLDHMPAGAGKQTFEFLDQRTIAAYRTVEPLQVAVDDEDQVVEAFA